MNSAAAKATVSECKLKYLASINDDVLGEDTDADSELQYIDIGNVDSSGRISEMASYRFENAPSRARRIVQEGDVVISTVRTYLQAISQIHAPPDNLVVSTGFAVVRPLGERLDARYCGFALREQDFLAEVERRSVGVNYPAINAKDLADIPIFVHLLPKQRAIAYYLDRETARLDALIAAKQRLLELLAEKRQAIVTHAVTRGLDPSVQLKPSGVEWIGDVPMRWEIFSVKNAYSIQLGKMLQNQPDGRYDIEVPYLKAQHAQWGSVDLTDLPTMWASPEEIDALRITVGDLLVCEGGEVGRAALVTDEPETPTIIQNALHVVRGKNGTDTRFLLYILRQAVESNWIKAICNTSTISHFTADKFGEMRVWMPDAASQVAIADYLDLETARLDALVAKVQGGIALVEERRAALISAAVAGEIDVDAHTGEVA